MNEMVVKYGGPSCMKNKHWVLKVLWEKHWWTASKILYSH